MTSSCVAEDLLAKERMLARQLPSLPTLLAAAPKAELHLHLDGSLRPTTLLELARDQKVELPTEDLDALSDILRPGTSCASLGEYLRAFDLTTAVMKTPEALERIAYELLEDQAADHVRYVEIRYSPILVAHDALSMEDAMRAVDRGLEAGERDFDIVSRQIACAMRDRCAETSLSIADAAVAVAADTRVVGFDLAGDESNHPPDRHAAAFLRARQAHLRATVHAGEAAGPASIAGALHLLGAERIGHSVALREDDALLAYMRDRGIVVEACPTSNVQTHAVESFETHPCLDFLRAGVPVALCTDNTMVSDTTLTTEFEQVIEHLPVTLDELETLLIAPFEASFAERDVRRALAAAAAETVRAQLEPFRA